MTDRRREEFMIIISEIGNRWYRASRGRIRPQKHSDDMRDIACRCSEEDKTGEPSVMCCNVCGLPTEANWTK